MLRPISPALIDLMGRIRIAASLAEWVTFELSVWHEVATWSGWKSVVGFSERVSAFSPEDLYSNLVGTRMIAAIAYHRSGRAENVYNASVDAWLKATLDYLGVVPKDVAVGAIRAVDGLWWASEARLPDAGLLRRRNLEVSSPLRPWLVPNERLDPKTARRLRELCGNAPEPMLLHYAQSMGEYDFRQWATLEIEVAAQLRAQSPLDAMSPRLTQEDFPQLIEAIRTQILHDFGARADRAD